MSAQKGYILVEGHGEVEAVQNLIVRLGSDIGGFHPWSAPRRWTNLHQWKSPGRGGVFRGAEFIRTKQDAAALLILKDEDDDCPKTTAPAVATRLRELVLPFPVAYVLLRPEYEVLFLPCIDQMGFPTGTKWDGEHWESHRGIKEWLSRQWPRGKRYKPTVDQLPMTQKLNFQTLREAHVPSFGSLERALIFLNEHFGRPGGVYPDAAKSQ